ncbi:MAG: hypothetical protein RIQ93_3318 [Verrucomicrobiota bacterium]
MLFETPIFHSPVAAVKRSSALVAVVAIFCGVIISTLHAAEAEWKAGVASVVISPELPMWMSGYGGRVEPGREIAADLHAKALAIEDRSGTRLVIVTTDLLGIPAILRKAVGEKARARFSLPDSALLINASHTHCGPELRPVQTTFTKRDPDRAATVAKYQAELEERLVGVIGQALERLAPASLAFGKAKAGFAMNRRKNYALPAGDPQAGKVPNPDGPVDHEVPVLQIQGNGKIIGLLFGYACHNTTSNASALHGDYAGFAQEALEKSFPGAIALFMQGCAGDQNPYPRQAMSLNRTSIDLARLHGQTLALAVEAALATTPRPVTGKLQVLLEDVQLPYHSIPSKTELDKRAASPNRETREYAQVLLELLASEGRLPESYPYPVQLVQFGSSLTLVALASETVVDFSHRLRRELPALQLWVAGYSNDFMGYIPSRRIWEEGGYEGGGALTYSSQTMYRVVHPNIWAPNVEELIVAKVKSLHGRIISPP